MCKPKSEGGQRCAAHTRPTFQQAAWGTQAWDTAAGEYAATREGRGILAQMRDGAKDDGDTLAAVAYDTALRRGQALNDIAEETVAEMNRQSRATREPAIEQSEHWGDWNINCGGYGMIKDDGMARWSSDQPDEATARKIAQQHKQISHIVWDYQTSRNKNPATESIRLRLELPGDGSLAISDYDYQHKVGSIRPDGREIVADPPPASQTRPLVQGFGRDY